MSDEALLSAVREELEKDRRPYEEYRIRVWMKTASVKKSALYNILCYNWSSELQKSFDAWSALERDCARAISEGVSISKKSEKFISTVDIYSLHV